MNHYKKNMIVLGILFNLHTIQGAQAHNQSYASCANFYLFNPDLLCQEADQLKQTLSRLKTWLSKEKSAGKLERVAKAHINRVIAQKNNDIHNATVHLKTLIGMIPNDIDQNTPIEFDNTFSSLNNTVISICKQKVQWKHPKTKDIIEMLARVMQQEQTSENPLNVSMEDALNITFQTLDELNKRKKDKEIVESLIGSHRSIISAMAQHQKTVAEKEIETYRQQYQIVLQQLNLEKKSILNFSSSSASQGTTLSPAQLAPEIVAEKTRLTEKNKETLSAIRAKLNSKTALTREEISFIHDHKPKLSTTEISSFRAAKNLLPEKGHSVVTASDSSSEPAEIASTPLLTPLTNNETCSNTTPKDLSREQPKRSARLIDGIPLRVLNELIARKPLEEFKPQSSLKPPLSEEAKRAIDEKKARNKSKRRFIPFPLEPAQHTLFPEHPHPLDNIASGIEAGLFLTDSHDHQKG